MILEEAVVKIAEEYAGILRLNCGYPCLEIWIENSQGDEEFLGSLKYKEKHKNISYIGNEKLENIEFSDEYHIPKNMNYETFKKVIFDRLENKHDI